ncbi:MAG TPA: TIGR03435 family protein [Steroidobacteraceae bacterium]|nr:TIGR03435 family protein [Steroidobacteraceae bacterium]
MHGFNSVRRAASLALLLCPTIGIGADFDQAQVHLGAGDATAGLQYRHEGNRYGWHNATLSELISRAWGVESDHILSGPRWLDDQRYDVDVTVATALSAQAIASDLQDLLVQRFGLRLQIQTRQVVAYTLNLVGQPRLQATGVSGKPGCDLKNGQNPSTTPGEARPPVTLRCVHESLAGFVRALSQLREASGYVLNYEIQDRTGLPGMWDFQLSWTPRNSWHADPVAAPGQSLFEAIETQLGMQLRLASVPTQVLVVRTARAPATTRTDHTLRFDEASIQASAPGLATLPCGRMEIRPGGVVGYHMSVRSLILESEGDLGIHRIVDPTDSIDATCWSVLAATPVRSDAPAGWSGTEWNGVEIGSMRVMLRALLAQAFGLKMHVEQRPVAGYALRARRPLLKPAEPGNRPGCHEGLGLASLEQSRADARLSNPFASRLITCRNVTLREFVPQFSQMITGVDGPVTDATGLSGRYDFAVNFSPGAWLQANSATTAHPLIPIAQALRTQLGLELQSREVTAPTLIIDQVSTRPIGSLH